MERSEQIEVLAAALCRAQGQISPPVRSEANPFFNSTYADLAEVWRVIRQPMTDNGLAVVQTVSGGDNGNVIVETLLLHSSGQWIKSDCRGEQSGKGVSAVQALGSAITYLRRYSLMALLGLAPVDDDGNGAGKKPDSKADGKPKTEQPKGRTKEQELYLAINADLHTLTEEGRLTAAAAKAIVAEMNVSIKEGGAKGYEELQKIQERVRATVKASDAEMDAAADEGFKA